MTTITRPPSHRCRVCGALWILWPPLEGPGQPKEGSWSLYSAHAGSCCDNVPMGDQIEPVAEAVERLTREIKNEKARFSYLPEGVPVPLILWCPACGVRHIDRGDFAVKPHHTHACQECGMVWRPAVCLTVGVQYLPGFKDVADASGK